MNVPLDPTAVVVVSDVRHRLALGIDCRDVVSGLGALGPMVAELESIGPFATPGMVLQPHGIFRHALPWAGAVRKLMAESVSRAVDPNWIVRIHGDPGAPAKPWDPNRDAHRVVPRRLRLLPTLTAGEPPSSPANARSCTLAPGAMYPLHGAATAIRGRVMHNATIPMPWAAVVATTPPAQTNFALATPVGRARADERGEFLLVLDGRSVTGASLPTNVSVRLWGFGPPAVPTPTNPKDPLTALPIEDAGSATDSPLLRGEIIPAAYTRSIHQTIAVRIATVASGVGATLTLP